MCFEHFEWFLLVSKHLLQVPSSCLVSLRVGSLISLNGYNKSWAGGGDPHPRDASELCSRSAWKSSFWLWFQLPSLIRQDSHSYCRFASLKKGYNNVKTVMKFCRWSFLCYRRLVKLFYFWTRLIFVSKLNVRLCSPWRKAERVSENNDRVSFLGDKEGGEEVVIGNNGKESEWNSKS